MFAIKKDNQNGFDSIVLVDKNSGTCAFISPSAGGILHKFEVSINGDMFNVIDSYTSYEEFSQSVESLGFKGCKLSPFVCRMNKGEYHFAQNHYKITKFYLGHHAIHGLIYDRQFKIITEEANEVSASVSILYNYRKDDIGFPFNYDCIITYKLEENNKLTISTAIQNMDKGMIPIQDGWHPYFKLGSKIDDLQLEFQSKEILEFDKELLPTGKYLPYQDYGSIQTIGNKTFDNCFLLNFADCQPMCVLRNKSKNIEVEISPENSYPYLQIYTPPHRNSIAIENLSSPPDGFNNGIDLKTTSPGEQQVFKTSYKITLLP